MFNDWALEDKQNRINLVETGHIKIDEEGYGEFVFGVVVGNFRINPKRDNFDV